MNVERQLYRAIEDLRTYMYSQRITQKSAAEAGGMAVNTAQRLLQHNRAFPSLVRLGKLCEVAGLRLVVRVEEVGDDPA